MPVGRQLPTEAEQNACATSSFFLAGLEGLATVEQQAAPAVGSGVRENPKHPGRLVGIAFGVVQLEVRVDFEGVRPAQPFGIVGEGRNRVSVTRRVEKRPHTAERLVDVGIKADIDLLPAGVCGRFGAAAHGEEGAGGRGSLERTSEVFSVADARRGATLRVGNFKSRSLRPSTSSRATRSRSPCRPSTRSTLA